MADIDTRTVERGRYFTPSEEEHRANVCLIGDTLVQQLFPSVDPIGATIRIDNDEFLVIGVMEKVGSVLGQDQDNFVMVPLSVYLRMKGAHTSVTINVKAGGGQFERAQDQAQLILRARRHIAPNAENDFFIGTKESYMALWRSISGAFFAVFIMVSAISVIIGGIVIMNVMLVSVTARKREIGVRRAVGATKKDVLRQFMAESVAQCIVGGLIGTGLWIPGGDVAADQYSVPGVGADVGGGNGSDPEFGGGPVLRNLSGAACVATGSDRRVEVGINGDASLTQPERT